MGTPSFGMYLEVGWTKMAMNQGGRMMNMTQHMEARYLGPCTK